MAKLHKSALANLQAAFALIKNPKNWIQDGWEEYDDNDEPVRFCAVGAVNHIDGRGEAAALGFLNIAQQELYPKYESVPHANDMGKRSTAHKRVLNIYKRAIELAKGASPKL